MAMKMIRPLWPYGEWTTSSEGSKEARHDYQRHSAIKCEGGEILNGLQTFLHTFDKTMGVFDDEMGKAVQKEVNQIMETTVSNLKARSPLFRSCRLKKSGSVVEGTKIGGMNEFDFLLVLESIKIIDIQVDSDMDVYMWLKRVQEEAFVEKAPNKSSIDSKYRMPRISVKVENSGVSSENIGAVAEVVKKLESLKAEPEDYFTYLQQSKFDTLFKSEDRMMQLTQMSLQHLMADEVGRVLHTYDDWKLSNLEELRDGHSACSRGNATTLHLRSDKYNLDVDIDVCFCIPIAKEFIDYMVSPLRFLFTNRYNQLTKSYLNFIKLVMQLEPELEIFALIGGGNKFLDLRSVFTRISFPGLEHSPFQQFGRDSGQVKAYKLAKCIASVFFPKQHSGCARCSHSILKSYHLKNIMLYMMNNHKDPGYWNDINVPNRVMEVFEILLECIQEREYNKLNAAKIATFSTPGSLSIDRFNNYGPLKSFFSGEEHMHKLYAGDEHAATRSDTAFWPEYNETLKTGVFAIDEAVKSHFYDFQHEHWDTGMLIVWVRDLLCMLRDIQVNSSHL